MFRSLTYMHPDCMKLYTKAHGAKVQNRSLSFLLWDLNSSQTTNLIINLDHDEWMLDDDSKLLADLGMGEHTCGPKFLVLTQLQRTRPKSASSAVNCTKRSSNTQRYALRTFTPVNEGLTLRRRNGSPNPEFIFPQDIPDSYAHITDCSNSVIISNKESNCCAIATMTG